ncbi:MAG: GNAT family N-acetyltransferase [Acidimicrobiales bacterium]
MDVPHWYLVLLGCDPAWQRQGHGSALLAPVLQRADEDGIPAYLETQKQENLPWYRRHGFEVVQEITARGCPRMWAMRRDPREPDSTSRVP